MHVFLPSALLAAAMLVAGDAHAEATLVTRTTSAAHSTVAPAIPALSVPLDCEETSHATRVACIEPEPARRVADSPAADIFKHPEGLDIIKIPDAHHAR